MWQVKPVSKSQQPLVVIYRPVDETGDSHRRLEAAGCRLVIVEPAENLATALERAGRVDAILAASLKNCRLDRSTIERMSDLRLIAKYTIGVDDVDVEAATEHGVLVTHSPTEANFGGVAEGTIALMLALLKRLAARDRSVRDGGWRSDGLRGTYVGSRADGYEGIVLGIVGFGRVGRRIAELMAPWNIRMLATDPYVDASVFARYGVAPIDLPDLLRRSDVVTLHCNLTTETRGLIGADAIGLMRPGSLLINTARGAVVDVDAVCAALDAGRLGGAAFDVLPEEPPPPGARILRTDDRVLLSPHMVAANVGGTLAAAIPWATDAVLDALAGRVPAHVYNESALITWRTRFEGSPIIASLS
jgi:D-3-phosphoglycerate dehydrogenase